MTESLKTNFIILSGPSGAGKTVISKALEKAVPKLRVVVATTSRLARKNEQDGEDYYFISEKEFEKRISDEEFLEWAKIGNFYYGIELKNCSAGLCLLNIDYQGTVRVKEKYPKALSIFIKPPSMEVLRKRLTNRAKETGMTEEEIKKRLVSAEKEMETAKFYDHSVVNRENKLDETVQEIVGMIESKLF